LIRFVRSYVRPSVCLSVCLSHAPSLKTARITATVIREHFMLKVEPTGQPGGVSTEMAETSTIRKIYVENQEIEP